MSQSLNVHGPAGRTKNQIGKNLLVFVAVAAASAAVTFLIARPRRVPPSGDATTASPIAGPVASIGPQPARPRLPAPDLELQVQAPTRLEVPDELSPFQKAALATPQTVAHLNNEIASSLGRMYGQVAGCYRGADRSSLEFHFLVRSKGLVADVVSARFTRIKSGAQLPQEVIACVEQTLNKPFTLLADNTRPFPRDVEGEMPWEFALGPP